jgi:hypothetical protein
MAKTKGVLKFNIQELLCLGEFSTKDLLDIIVYMESKDKRKKDETISNKK